MEGRRRSRWAAVKGERREGKEKGKEVKKGTNGRVEEGQQVASNIGPRDNEGRDQEHLGEDKPGG